METGTIIALVAVGLQFVSFIVIAVWVVGKIRTTTETLGILIQGLTDNINRLHNWLNEVDAKNQEHGERIAKTETKLDLCNSKLFPKNPSGN